MKQFLILYFAVLNFSFINCKLWPKGIVHYAINSKDYDLHSQDEITSTLQQIEKEVCVKFFNTPLNYTANDQHKILYISNPDRRKNCQPNTYSFNGSIVDLPIGYKCLDRRNISRLIVDMLRASIVQPVGPVSSYDLVRKFQEMNEDSNRPTLLTPTDRNYINGHYHSECGQLSQPAVPDARRHTESHIQMSEENKNYYEDKLWPFGIVMYGVEASLKISPEYSKLIHAMTTIEMMSCVVFQEAEEEDVLEPRSLLLFSSQGSDMPELGRVEGKQEISLSSMAEGAPGHSAHTLNLLLRALGIPMMSSRYDRDNYIVVHWNNIEDGKEHIMEKTPIEAWLSNGDEERVEYDFDSATHAPANYLCANCSLSARTVLPIQDYLWQRTMTMGHVVTLSAGDTRILYTLYNNKCRARYATTH